MSSWNAQQFIQDGLESTNPYGNYTVVDAAPKDMLDLIDPHWYQFPPMNPLMYDLLGFVIGAVGLMAWLGNFATIYIFLTTRALRSPANMLVINLAISDFIMITCMSPPMVVSCYYRTWAFSRLSCELYGFIGSICGAASITTMIFITEDRYNVIVKGISGKPLSSGGAFLRILIVWTFSLFWTLPPFFGWNRYVPEGNLTACGTDYLTQDFLSQSYLYLFSVFCWLVPLIWIVYAYYNIVGKVFAHEKQMREQAKRMGVKSLRNEETQKTSTEMKLAKVALMNVSLWFIAWTPYLIINFTGMLAKDMINPLFTIWGALFAKANAIYNPIIYAISHPKYKAALEKKMPCLACTSEPNYEAEVQSTSTVPENAEKA